MTGAGYPCEPGSAMRRQSEYMIEKDAQRRPCVTFLFSYPRLPVESCVTSSQWLRKVPEHQTMDGIIHVHARRFFEMGGSDTEGAGGKLKDDIPRHEPSHRG